MYYRFSADEFKRRYALVRRSLEAHDLDAYLVFGWSAVGGAVQADVHYLSNFLGMRDNYVLFPARSDPVLFAQNYNHVPNAAEVSVIDDVRWAGRDSGATLGAEIHKRGLSRIGIVGLMPYQHWDSMKRCVGNKALFSDMTSSYRAIRVSKSEEEISWLREGARYTDLALQALEDELKPGLKERELGEIVESAYRHHGGQTVFRYILTTSMGDPQGCVPAQVLSNRVIQSGDVVVVEISAAFEGYAGQGLRTYGVDSEPSNLYYDLHRTAETVFHELCTTIRTGASTEDVLLVSDEIDRAGFTIRDGLVHGFGMGILPPSIGTRETPHQNQSWEFSRDETVVVQPNIVTLDERAGVQTGHLCRVRDDGLESLHGYPLKFIST